jgi:hypothetical protein
VFASSANSDQVTVSYDTAALCSTPLRLMANADYEDLSVVVHDYNQP